MPVPNSFFKKKIILFILLIYFWLCGVFIVARAFLWLQCSGLSLQWLLLFQSTGSRAHRLQYLGHVGSVVSAPRLQSTSSIVAVPRLSCYTQHLLLTTFIYNIQQHQLQGFPCGSTGKKSACNVGDQGSIPGWGRSPGEGKGYQLQYSGLENSMDYTVHGVAKTQT